MKNRLLTAAVACSILGIGPVGAVSAQGTPPNGNAYGYWAGRLCDASNINGVPGVYWQTRGYKNRGECVKAEGESLRKGEWDPDDFGL